MSNVEKLFSYLGPLNGLMDAIAKKREADLCESCGSEDVFRNSCGEIQCDNCGFDEGNDEAKQN